TATSSAGTGPISLRRWLGRICNRRPCAKSRRACGTRRHPRYPTRRRRRRGGWGIPTAGAPRLLDCRGEKPNNPWGAMSESSPVALRHNRDFRLLWIGQAVSTLGTNVSSVAFPLLVLATRGSAADAGLVGFLGTLPLALLQLPAGALVDRWD